MLGRQSLTNINGPEAVTKLDERRATTAAGHTAVEGAFKEVTDLLVLPKSKSQEIHHTGEAPTITVDAAQDTPEVAIPKLPTEITDGYAPFERPPIVLEAPAQDTANLIDRQ
jgi:hypothetical protein